MKSFCFSLQSLRVLREQKEQVAQKRYAEALHTGEQAAARLDAGSRELAEARSSLCQEVLAGRTISQLQRIRVWCRHLEQDCEQRAAALKSAEEAVGKAWRDMLAATRDRKTIDSLHRQRRREYDYTMQREEQKHLDEMGLHTKDSSSNRRELAMTSKEQP